MKKNDCSYFQNRDCQYFPCHPTRCEDFNCLFCYCPLYALGDRCGGKYAYLENGIKDCSGCMIPHSDGGYEFILSRFREVVELASENRKKE